MREGVLAAAGVAFLTAAIGLSAAPAQAVPISAPAALQGAGQAIGLTANVCYGECGYYDRPRYDRPYYRPNYRSYDDRPYYRSYSNYDRPYYRSDSYYDRPYSRPYYRSYSYDGPSYSRPVPWWVSGPYRPRPRYYIGPNVYGY